MKNIVYLAAVLIILGGCTSVSEDDYIKKSSLIKVFDMYDQQVEQLEQQVELNLTTIKEQENSIEEARVKLQSLENEIENHRSWLKSNEEKLTKLDYSHEQFNQIRREQNGIMNEIALLRGFMTSLEGVNIQIGYVSYNHSNPGVIQFDDVEWMDLDDETRIEALNLDPDSDLPSGFYVHNEIVKFETLDYREDIGCYIYDDTMSYTFVSIVALEDKTKQFDLDGLLCHLYFIDDQLTVIEEVYLP